MSDDEMNEAQRRENFWASRLICWVASGLDRRLTIGTGSDLGWKLRATDGPWELTSEGATFAETAERLVRFAPDRFDDDPE